MVPWVVFEAKYSLKTENDRHKVLQRVFVAAATVEYLELSASVWTPTLINLKVNVMDAQ